MANRRQQTRKRKAVDADKSMIERRMEALSLERMQQFEGMHLERREEQRLLRKMIQPRARKAKSLPRYSPTHSRSLPVPLSPSPRKKNKASPGHSLSSPTPQPHTPTPHRHSQPCTPVATSPPSTSTTIRTHQVCFNFVHLFNVFDHLFCAY